MTCLNFNHKAWKSVALFIWLALSIVPLVLRSGTGVSAANSATEESLPAAELSHQDSLQTSESRIAGEIWVLCTPVEVAVLNNRISLKCSESYGQGIRFFAFPTSETAASARFLSLLSTAQVAGRTLSILYDPADLSGADFTCAVSNCRALHGAAFGQ